MYRGSSGDGQYGAFQRSDGDSTNYTVMKSDHPAYNAVINFSAGASSSIYSGAKNQPSALQCLACIRV